MPKKIYEQYELRNVGDKDIGIEIEVEGDNLPAAIAKFWNVKQDGSLRGNNYEYILKTPVQKGKTQERLKYLQEELKKHDAVLQLSDRCGVHIHVNCQQLTTKQVLNFALLYLIFEDILVKWCGEQREGNLFCLRASDAEHLLLTLVECRKHNNLRYVLNNHYRYASMNMAAIRKFGSLEFRAMGTPKRFALIQTWIEMLLRVKEASLGYNEPYEIVEDLSVTGGLVYVRRVFGPLYKHLVCPDIDKLCVDGVRRVQQIAYTPYEEDNENMEGLLKGQVAWQHVDVGEIFNRPQPMPRQRIRRDDDGNIVFEDEVVED